MEKNIPPQEYNQLEGVYTSFLETHGMIPVRERRDKLTIIR